MLGDLFSKLQDARQKIEEAKRKLNSIIIETRSENGEIIVKANANKIITSIGISENYKNEAPTGELEEALMNTLNRALEEAAKNGEEEMKKITKDVLPNFPGLI